MTVCDTCGEDRECFNNECEDCYREREINRKESWNDLD